MKWSWPHAALTLGSFALIWAALTAIGVIPGDAFAILVKQSLGNPRAISGTLREMMPLLIAGLAVWLGLRAGLFNIGAEGQLLVGAMTAAAFGLALPNPVGIVGALIGGGLAGAAWAWPAGWIKARRGGHEVITTIMLNNVAMALTGLMVRGPMKSPTDQTATTSALAAATHLPELELIAGIKVSLALVLGLILAAGLAVWMKRHVKGLEIEAVGGNPEAARHAGIEPGSVQIQALSVSGALAGLAGASLVLAFEHRFYADFSAGYGFDALGVALLAGRSAWMLIPTSLLFAILAKGATALSLNGVPKGMSGVLLGLIIIVFAVYSVRKKA